MSFIVAVAAPTITQPSISVTNVTTTTAQINLTAAATGAPNLTYTLTVTLNPGSSPQPSTVTYAVTSFPYTVTALVPGTNYGFAVTATDNAQNIYNSMPSAQVLSATGSTASPPGQVTGVTAVAVNGSTVNVSWNLDANTTSYSLVRNGSIFVTGLAALTYQDTGLTAGTTYAYQVIAVNTSGNSPISATASVTTPAQTNVFGIKVSGNKLISTANSQQINLIGSAMISSEEAQGWAGGAGGRIKGVAAATKTEIQAAVSKWGTTSTSGLSASAQPYGVVNMIRVPLNSTLWMGYTGLDALGNAAGNYYLVGTDSNGKKIYSGGPGGGLGSGPGHETNGDPTQYRNYIKQEVANILAAGLYVLLDLHWGTPLLISTGQKVLPAGQPALPSTPDLAFWIDIANTFGTQNAATGSPAIMFESFNEPFGNSYPDYFGDLFYEAKNVLNSSNPAGIAVPSGYPGGANGGYWMKNNFANTDANTHILGGNAVCLAVGHQAIINGIRGTNAKNIIWCGPGNVSSEFRDGGLGGGNLWLDMGLTDSAGQLGCSWHSYNANVHSNSFDQVQAAGFPVLCTEMGNFDTSNSYVNARSKGQGYTWWTWNNFGSSGDMGPSMSSTAPWSGNFAIAPNGGN